MKRLDRPTSVIKKIIGTLGQIYRSLYFPPAVIFVIIFVATILGWQAARDSLHQDIAAAADSRADTAEQTLREHMVTYEQILHGGAGLFQTSNVITNNQWNNYLNTFNVGTNLSGVQAISFVKVFKAEELPAITSFMATQGVKNFEIIPAEPPQDEYAALLYVYGVGVTETPPYGFNMYTEPARRVAMLRARDTGNVAMTSRAQLLPKNPAAQRYGFIIYAPYYQNLLSGDGLTERQAKIRGYVSASFDSNNFFRHTIGHENDQTMGYYVATHEGKSTSVLYESPTFKSVASRPLATRTTRTISIYGQVWTMTFVFDSRKLIGEGQLNRPEGLLFFGTLSAFLVAAVVLLLIKARARDLKTQKEKAVELAKDELLSLASHQLRTPATGVKQYVGMVLQGFAGKVPATQRKLLEKAYSSNDRQLRIINEILHLAKIDSGRIVLAKQITNLNELVGDVINEQSPDIEASKHTIDVNLPAEPIAIYADTHMLRMAIENLLSNAIKYTPNGGHITVHVYKERSRARISITDTGVGISSDDTDKIFRQFSRLSNIMSQQVGGTGIGLYLAKHLVELHKGSIRVESEPGEGSTFTITLPLHGDLGERMRNLTVEGKA